MKKRTTFVSLLLIGVLTLSATPLIFGNFASASTCAANFLPTNFQIWVDTANEYTLSHSTANYIVSVLNSRYPIFDYRDSSCTGNNFKTILSSLQSYDTAVIYSKGHRDADTCSYGNAHYGLIMNDSTTVWDTEIYPRTSSKNVHTFIWHCQTGIKPPGTNPDACGYRGLPVAFTHNVNIDTWDDSGDQVYLGWYDKQPLWAYNFTSQQYYQVTINGGTLVGSPQYEWGINPNYNYANVAGTYYYRMGQGDSTVEALIEMAYIVYGNDFQYTNLANWLVVWGDMYTALP